MLKKLFIKNYKNTNDPDVRNSYGKVAGIFGIVTNLILGIIKFIIGIISHSVSIMADAANNIADMASSTLTIIGFKLSSKKPDKEHPYGHARYEYVAGLIIAILMLIMGLTFAKESLVKIFNPEELVINTTTYIILGIAVLGKLFQMFVYLDFSKAIESNTLKANAIDTRNDIISSTAILISMIIMGIFKINIDGYLGLGVSLFVVYSAYNTIKEVLEPIIGILPTEERTNMINNKLLSYECVLGIHDLVLHNYGVNNDFITVHVEIDYKMDLLTSHDLIDRIERDFKKVGLNLTIHIDPVITGNQAFDEIKEKVITEIKRLDSKLTIHDFRIIEDFSHTNILFDCVIPYEKSFNKQEIVNHLRKNIIDEDQNYNYIIEIDRPFC